MAVLAENGGIWPGVRTPSYALFLWASGSELTSILQADHMPNKYIPKELRSILYHLLDKINIELSLSLLHLVQEW